MQYFFYDPILGLQYFCYENIIELEFDHIPDFKIGDLLDLMYTRGIVLQDSSKIISVNEIGSIGSNMFDCNMDAIEFTTTKKKNYNGIRPSKFINDEIGVWPRY